ncbi:MAG: DUF6931 family protein [Planctomycetota bacterium]
MDVNSGGVPPTLLPTMRPVVISGAEAAFVVASRTKLSARAKALTGGLNSHLFVTDLIKRGRRADAVKFIAAWLPPRESLWYATLGVWQTYRLLNQSGAEEILRRVAAFVRVPTADNLTAIGQAKEILRDGGTVGLLAQAALFTGENISSVPGKTIKPGAHLTRKMAGTALVIAAAQWPGSKKLACLDQFISMGLDIAEGLHLWEPNPQQKHPGLRHVPNFNMATQKSGNIWENWK